MVDSTTIFSGDNSTDTDSKTDASTGELLEILVGEGKKYKTPNELAKAYMSADDFIEKLKEENRELREKMSSAKTLEDVLSKLERTPTGSDKPDTSTLAEGMSATDIAHLVRNTVTGLETEKTKRANLLKADSKMKALFGDKAAEKYKEAAPTKEQHEALMMLASIDPDKFIKLFESVEKPSTTQTDTSGSSNTIITTTGGDRTKTPGTKPYYDALRREKPSLYYSQAIQLEMDAAARRDPDKFYGRT